MMRVHPVTLAMAIALATCGHVGSPTVFFSGAAGPYEIRVVVWPPEVVPGIARVTVRTGANVHAVSIRPVFWRAGSRGAPSADPTRRVPGDSLAFEGSLWLMQQGAYGVDVIVQGTQGTGTVLVPVASVATGRLDMSGGMAALLVALGLVLCAGLVTIVRTAAGEALLPLGAEMDAARRRRARRVAALSVPVVALALLGGARWWGAVDRDYVRDLYRPSPLVMTKARDGLHVALGDTLWQPGRRISRLVPDHGKLMHLFLVRRDDARGFAHLHPLAADTGAMPVFRTRLPALPAGEYHAFGDVVHETGFERTLVGSVSVAAADSGGGGLDAEDGWYAGDASRDGVFALADGSLLRLTLVPAGLVEAGREQSIRVALTDKQGAILPVEPYLGMTAHAVVVRVDGSVYVHLHPMGTISSAAQQVFEARERGDTTATGRLRVAAHAGHATADSVPGEAEFPYAFPRGGSYRIFVQMKRAGRIVTGAFAVTVAERADPGP